MNAANWYFLAWNRTFEVNGRSRRKEFVHFFLLSALIAFLLFGIGSILDQSEPRTITRIRAFIGFYLAVIIVPKSTLTIRRLHDVDVTGWLFLLGLVPFAGLVLDAFCLIADSDPRPNKWGVSPKFEGLIGP